MDIDFFSRNNPDCAPSALQLSFIKIVAPLYNFIGLGDSDHRVPEIPRFALHETMLGALAEGGKMNYFMEQMEEAQPFFDALKTGQASALPLRAKIFSSHLSAADNERINADFEKAAARHPGISFFAADRRTKEDLTAGFLLAEKPVVLNYLQFLASGQQDKARALRETNPFLGLKEDVLARNLTGTDYVTAEYIVDRGEGAIFFGSRHLRSDAANPGNLREIFGAVENGICSIDIYKSAWQRETAAPADTKTKSDVEFYIVPPAGRGSEIKIINPVFESCYRQALAVS